MLCVKPPFSCRARFLPLGNMQSSSSYDLAIDQKHAGGYIESPLRIYSCCLVGFCLARLGFLCKVSIPGRSMGRPHFCCRYGGLSKNTTRVVYMPGRRLHRATLIKGCIRQPCTYTVTLILSIKKSFGNKFEVAAAILKKHFAADKMKI